MICPNFKNKQVFSEFNEMIEAFGGKPMTEGEFRDKELRNQREGDDYAAMELAYHIWHANNGNSLELAPNGANSKLFKDLLKLNNGNRKATIIAKAKVYSKNFIDWFGDWTGETAVYDDEGNRVDEVSKVVDENGEPLVVYHGSPDKFDTFSYDFFGRTDPGDNGRGFYFAYRKEVADLYGDVNYPVFLSVKNPFIHTGFDTMLKVKGFNRKYNPTNREQLESRIKSYENQIRIDKKALKEYKDDEFHVSLLNKRILHKTNTLKQLQHDLKIKSKEYLGSKLFDTLDEYDGVMEKDPHYQIVVRHENQIKSATNNNGYFSTEDDNIYHNLNQDNRIQSAIQQLINNHFVHNYFGTIRLSKRANLNYNVTVQQIKNQCKFFGVYPIISENGVIQFAETEYTDEIEKNEDNIREINKVIDFLKQRFPTLKVVWLPKKVLEDMSGQKTNAFVKDSVVYLSLGLKSSQIAAEELLHPFVTALLFNNPDLFNSLLDEAKKSFPKLATEIEATYTNKKGFKNSDRQNELVTQALSRYFVKEFKETQGRKSFNDVAKEFFSWVAYQLRSLISKYGIEGERRINTDELPKMSFKELALLLNSNDVTFRVITDHQMKHSLEMTQENIDGLQERLAKQFSILYNTYRRIGNSKTNTQQKIQDKAFTTLNKIKEIRVDLAIESLREAILYCTQQLGSSDINVQQTDDTLYGYLYNQSILTDPNTGESTPFADLTAEELMNMLKNQIGFISNLINTCFPTSNTTALPLSPQDRSMINNLTTTIDHTYQLWQKAIIVVGDRIVDEWFDQHAENFGTTEEVEAMRKNAKDWLHYNISNNDVSTLNRFMADRSFSLSLIVRIGFNMIQSAKTKTQERVVEISNKLLKAFDKINRNNIFRFFNSSWQTILMEKDEHGNFTGKFKRSRNYGVMQRNLDKDLNQLNKDFQAKHGFYYAVIDGITYRVHDEPDGYKVDQRADIENWSQGMPPYIEYMREKEKIEHSHGYKRYTLKYYLEQLSEPYDYTSGYLDINGIPMTTRLLPHGLSPDTLTKYNKLTSDINYILDQCTDDKGIVRVENLSNEHRIMLESYRLQLDDLKNPFDIYGQVKHDHDAKRMAFEIMAFEKWVNEQTGNYVDFNAFYKEIKNIEKQYDDPQDPECQQKISDFYKYNTIYQINPNYTAEAESKGMHTNRGSESSRVFKYRLLKSALLKLSKDKKGKLKLTRDLNLFAQPNCLDYWIKCRIADIEIESGKTKSSQDAADAYDEYFDTINLPYEDEYGVTYDKSGNIASSTTKQDQLKTWKEYLIDYYTDLIYNSPNKLHPQLKLQNGQIADFSGMSRDAIKAYILKHIFEYSKKIYDNRTRSWKVISAPISILQIMIPKKDSTYDGEPSEGLIPSGRFSLKFDKGSGILENPNNFNPSENESLQPRWDKYDNRDEFDKIAKNKLLYEYYNLLISTMREFAKEFGLNETLFDYSLPLTNATADALLSRIFKRGPIDVIKQLWTNLTEVLPDDFDMRDMNELSLNPDGSYGMNIPTRMLTKLKDQSKISSNILGGVKMYVFAALNYKYCKEILAKLELLGQNLKNENRPKTDVSRTAEDQQKQYDNMLDTFLYEDTHGDDLIIQNNGAAQIEKPSKRKIFWRNVINFIMRTMNLLMLYTNLPSMVVGGADSIVSLFIGSLKNNYCSVLDFSSALLSSIAEAPAYLLNMGNSLPFSIHTNIKQLNNFMPGKTLAMMNNFGINGSIYDKAGKSNKGRFRKLIPSVVGTTALGAISWYVCNDLLGLDQFAEMVAIGMSMFSIIDYFAKSIQIKTLCTNIRFYDGNEIPKGFYNSHEFRVAFLKAGYSGSKAFFEHLKAGLCGDSLWNAYQYDPKTRSVYVKDKYKLYVTDYCKQKVRGTSMILNALMNGMDPENDGPEIKNSTKPLTKWLARGMLVLRSWIRELMLQYFVGPNDTIDLEYREKPLIEIVNRRSKISRNGRLIDKNAFDSDLIRLSINFETGRPFEDIIPSLFSFGKTICLYLYNWIKTGKRKGSPIKYRQWNAAKHVIASLAVVATIAAAWPSYHEYTKENVTPPHENIEYEGRSIYKDSEALTKAREVAKPQKLVTYDKLNGIQSPWANQGLHVLLFDDIYFRTIESLLNKLIFVPSSTNLIPILDVIKNGTPYLSPLADWASMVYDIFQEDSVKNEILKGTSSYKFRTKDERIRSKFVGPVDNLFTWTSYYNLLGNERYYINSFGGIYKKFGYDPNKAIKKENESQGQDMPDNSGFGGNSFGNNSFGNDSFGGGSFGGSEFGK